MSASDVEVTLEPFGQFLREGELVVLRGGVAVPLPALELAWSLEDRGCHIALEAEDTLRVGPGELLTDEDRARIRRWKPALIALVRYCEAIQ